jgi:hypothetical protein
LKGNKPQGYYILWRIAMRKKIVFFLLVSAIIISANSNLFSDEKLKSLFVKQIKSGEVTSITIYKGSGYLTFDELVNTNDIQKFSVLDDEILVIEKGKNNIGYIPLSEIKAYTFNSKDKRLILYL